MSQARLGIRVDIDLWLYNENKEYLAYAIKNAKHKMSCEIVSILSESKTPIVFRWMEKLDTEYAFDKHVYTIICEHRPVDVMELKMYEMPPFEFIATEHNIIEWQCDHCGQVSLVEKHLECRKCGAPRRVMR